MTATYCWRVHITTGHFSCIIWFDRRHLNPEAVCVACPMGRFNEQIGSSDPGACELCAKGTWSMKTGADTSKVCELCPAGKWSPAKGATTPLTCADCSRGTWSSTKGASSLLACNKCARGTYSEEMAATNETTCSACPVGTYQPIPGASNHTLCIPCAVNDSAREMFGIETLTTNCFFRAVCLIYWYTDGIWQSCILSKKGCPTLNHAFLLRLAISAKLKAWLYVSNAPLETCLNLEVFWG